MVWKNEFYVVEEVGVARIIQLFLRKFSIGVLKNKPEEDICITGPEHGRLHPERSSLTCLLLFIMVSYNDSLRDNGAPCHGEWSGLPLDGAEYYFL